jgi:hypothetical protein
MSLSNYTWSNTGGIKVFSGSKVANVQATGQNNWQDFAALYHFVSKFIYDKVNKDRIIIIN